MFDNGPGVLLTFLFAALLIGGLVLMILVAVRVIVGGISREEPAARRGDRGGRPGEERRSVDEQYARGELSTEEYLERVERLHGGS